MAAFEKLLLMEVCCSPSSLLSQAMINRKGEKSAERMSSWNGFHLGSSKGNDLAREAVVNTSALHLWISSKCCPLRPANAIGIKNEKDAEIYRRRRDLAIRQYRGAIQLDRSGKRFYVGSGVGVSRNECRRSSSQGSRGSKLQRKRAGISPLQHALRRAPDTHGRFFDCELDELREGDPERIDQSFGGNHKNMLKAELQHIKWQHNQKLSKAANSKTRGVTRWTPGMWVKYFQIKEKKSEASKDLLASWRRKL